MPESHRASTCGALNRKTESVCSYAVKALQKLRYAKWKDCNLSQKHAITCPIISTYVLHNNHPQDHDRNLKALI